MAAKPLPRITAFHWVPEFAKGRVRDIRVRWALEEVGQRYEASTMHPREPREDSYLDWHPFGQVPAYDDGEVAMFETGAILLRIAEDYSALMPTEKVARWRATSWLFAACSTIEPTLNALVSFGKFNAGQPWAEGAMSNALPLAHKRLGQLAQALAQAEWLGGEFCIADLAMAANLGLLEEDLLAEYPRLVAYRDAAFARPAYGRALAAHMADFKD